MNDKQRFWAFINTSEIIFIVLFMIKVIVCIIWGDTQAAWNNAFATWFLIISAKLTDLERKVEAMK